VEERDGDEVRFVAGARVLPEAVPVWNPAFDVTPAEWITGLITEVGLLRPPLPESIRGAFGEDRG